VLRKGEKVWATFVLVLSTGVPYLVNEFSSVAEIRVDISSRTRHDELIPYIGVQITRYWTLMRDEHILDKMKATPVTEYVNYRQNCLQHV
jgi:hypothetical protein